MGTARVKEEEEADSKIIVKEEHEIWKKGTWVQKRRKVPNKAQLALRI